MRELEPGGNKPGGDLVVRKAEPRMGVAAAQLLALMRREIGDQQSPAGLELAHVEELKGGELTVKLWLGARGRQADEKAVAA
jgi:hypothetical protein